MAGVGAEVAGAVEAEQAIAGTVPSTPSNSEDTGVLGRLTTCEDCGGRISTRVLACIHCGAPREARFNAGPRLRVVERQPLNNTPLLVHTRAVISPPGGVPIAPQRVGVAVQVQQRIRRTWKRMDKRVAVAWLVVAAVAFAWPMTDLDEDGIAAKDELGLGTNVARADSDFDGLGDGFEVEQAFDPTSADSDEDRLDDGWEHQHGLNVLSKDSDGDGVPDATEVASTSDPLDTDSDGDGIADGAEFATDDCDGDGHHARIDPDDDDDRRIDGEEPSSHRCVGDFDGDDVIDGDELALQCITRPDCDDDGIPDGNEEILGFDPLDADTHSANLPDGTMQLFAAEGQEATGDVDGDGIPGGWETGTGLLDWGDFQPDPQRPDLLIEFLRVVDDGSMKVRHISFEPAYEDVKEMFEDAGYSFQWVETEITLDGMTRPSLIPSAYGEYYEDLLGRAEYATNPFVTTVVMNPQHDQSEILHGGVAPIRGMLAAVDYGAYTTLTYGFNGTDIEMFPLFESAIDGGRMDIVYEAGFTDGGWSGGMMFVEDWDYRLTWNPYWYGSSIWIEDKVWGDVYRFDYRYAMVRQGELASVIAHELGHTLGLCHVELEECARDLSARDRFNAEDSTMHTYADPETLLFLESEWESVARYIACPPPGPIALLGQGATKSVLIEEKYGIDLEEVLDVNTRSCGEFVEIKSDLTPQDSEPDYYEPLLFQEAATVDNSRSRTVSYAVGLGILFWWAGLYAIHRGRKRHEQDKEMEQAFGTG